MPTETGRELDAAIAREVFNLAVKTTGGEATWKVWELDTNRWSNMPYYSTDRNAAALVLAEIERRGLRREMVDKFWDSKHLSDVVCRDYDEFWEYLNATPEAICLSALAAVKGGKV